MRILRTVVALVSVLVIAPAANATTVSVGDTVTFADGPGNTGGGEFILTVNHNPAETFITFCLQMTRIATFGPDFIVTGVSSYAIFEPESNGGNSEGKDYLSSQTAWLYTQFGNGTLAGYDGSENAANALQWAIWVLEGEAPSVPVNSWSDGYAALANQFIAAANAAVANGYSGIGDVRVLNLVTAAGEDAQDQLVRVPEPSSLALLGVGLISLRLRRRRS